MRYTKLTVIIKPNSKLPYFIGSQIRGAFGYGLKKVRSEEHTSELQSQR